MTDSFKLRFLFFAYACTFLVLIAIVAYRFIDIGKMEDDIKQRYIHILENYTLYEKGAIVPIGEDRSCVYQGYWYPVCPEDDLEKIRRDLNGTQNRT